MTTTLATGLAIPAPDPSAEGEGKYRRRGGCPGLSAPMQTGDGLLVRMRPRGTIGLAAFNALCAAAREYGNGIIEVTARGSIQVRGLTRTSSAKFAEAVTALGIAAEDGIPILTDPLAGLAAHQIVDTTTFAEALRSEISLLSLGSSVNSKISVAIDGGGEVNLDSISADIRLRAATAQSFCLSLAGDAVSAIGLGLVGGEKVVETVTRLLEVVAERGRGARVRDILRTEGPQLFASRIADLLINRTASYLPQRPSKAIGLEALGDSSFAYGIGLPFGHADAALLQFFNQSAQLAGAHGWRTAGRSLVAIGLSHEASHVFAVAAERLDFIVRADDPRRRVVACAGAPVCASGHIAARPLGARIAQAAAPSLSASSVIHVSGCAKGCAHPAPAALTVVGMPEGCALIANGTARDTPFAVVAADQMPTAVVNAIRERCRV